MNQILLDIAKKYLKKGGSVMELGCGDGELVSQLCKDYPNLERVVAVDLFRQPKNLQPKVEFLKQDLENLQVSGSFDLVILSQVLEHIKNPVGLLERVKSLLNKHGKILIEVPNRRGFNNSAKVYMPEHGKHYFLWDQDSLQFTLERLGFTCRFYNLYSIGSSNNLLIKYLPIIFKIQNPNLICLASVDD